MYPTFFYYSTKRTKKTIPSFPFFELPVGAICLKTVISFFPGDMPTDSLIFIREILFAAAPLSATLLPPEQASSFLPLILFSCFSPYGKSPILPFYRAFGGRLLRRFPQQFYKKRLPERGSLLRFLQNYLMRSIYSPVRVSTRMISSCSTNMGTCSS